MTKIAVRRALISVYDKTGLDDLARGLHEAGVEIVSTGSTAARIRDAGIPVTPVDEVTGFPEILGGRVKTLHPHVHAGLLADQTDPAHVATIGELGIEAFQLAVVNLYPFRETVGQRRVRRAEVIEQIDIGGPAMVRASCEEPRLGRGRRRPGPVRRGARRGRAPAGSTSPPGSGCRARRVSPHRVLRHRRRVSWLGSVVAPDDDVDGASSGFPGWVAASWERAAVLRYGENPHQRAALYIDARAAPAGLAQADQLVRQGDELQQLRRRRRGAARRLRLRRAVRGDHQARQPVRHRGRRRHRRGAPQGARLRPGAARTAAWSRRTVRSAVEMAEQLRRRSSPRSSSRRPSRTACSTCWAKKKDLRRARRRARPVRPAASSCGRSPAACWCRPPTGSTRPATTRPTWTLAAGDAGRRGHAGRPGVRLARRARGQVQRDPAGARRRRRSASGWAR